MAGVIAERRAARAARADEVAVFASASEGFSKANLNATIDESLARFAPVMEAAQADGIPVRGYVSVVTDCPFDGPTPPANVARVAARLFEMGCYEISLGDTIGQGRPETIDAVLAAVLDTGVFWGVGFAGEDLPWVTWALGDLGVKLVMAVCLLLPFRLLIGTRATTNAAPSA